MKTFLMAAAAALSLTAATSAFAAEPIVGTWRSEDGGLVQIASCGEAYCATVIKGEHKGESVGRMSGSGSQYTGTVKDPRDEKSYDGSAKVEGSQLTLEGCALKILCKSQVWTRA